MSLKKLMNVLTNSFVIYISKFCCLFIILSVTLLKSAFKTAETFDESKTYKAAETFHESKTYKADTHG